MDLPLLIIEIIVDWLWDDILLTVNTSLYFRLVRVNRGFKTVLYDDRKRNDLMRTQAALINEGFNQRVLRVKDVLTNPFVAKLRLRMMGILLSDWDGPGQRKAMKLLKKHQDLFESSMVELESPAMLTRKVFSAASRLVRSSTAFSFAGILRLRPLGKEMWLLKDVVKQECKVSVQTFDWAVLYSLKHNPFLVDLETRNLYWIAAVPRALLRDVADDEEESVHDSLDDMTESGDDSVDDMTESGDDSLDDITESAAEDEN